MVGRGKVANEILDKLIRYDGEGNPRCAKCNMLLHVHDVGGVGKPTYIHFYPVCPEWKESGLYYYDRKPSGKRFRTRYGGDNGDL
jgi:hypothetical protein